MDDGVSSCFTKFSLKKGNTRDNLFLVLTSLLGLGHVALSGLLDPLTALIHSERGAAQLTCVCPSSRDEYIKLPCASIPFLTLSDCGVRMKDEARDVSQSLNLVMISA